MNFLHNPLGYGWSMNLDAGTRLEIIDYIPLAQQVPFASSNDGFSAFQLQIRGDKFAQTFEPWLSLDPVAIKYGLISYGPGSIEALGRCHSSLIPEFLKPPGPDELGKKGVLAIRAGGTTYRLSVDKEWKTKVPLGTSGWSVTINKLIDDPKAVAEQFHDDLATFGPALELELSDPKGGSTHLMVLAWRPDKILNVEKQRWLDIEGSGRPSMMFHAAKVDRGLWRMPLTGVFQFIEGTDGQLFFRTFTRDKEAKNFILEEAGPVDVENQKEQAIWHKMGWRFRVLEYFPRAEYVDDIRAYKPVPVLPGKETEKERQMYRTVAFCRLTKGADKQEFWLTRGSGKKVTVGDRSYMIRYDNKVRNVGFTVKLERAETTRDPGTGSAATYTSFVQVFDPKNGVNGERHVITMNEPLEYGGFTFYQSQLQPTEQFDATGRPVSYSGFTVSRDPGLPLKYAGSIMLALGISIMFYMKAYFFKPRRRPAAGTPTA
jgi:hypothetical protein